MKRERIAGDTPLQMLQQHNTQALYSSVSFLVLILFLSFSVCFVIFKHKKKHSPFHTNDSSSVSRTREEGFLLYDGDGVIYKLQMAIASTCWDKMKTVQFFKPPNETNGMKQSKQIAFAHKSKCDFSIPSPRLFTCRFSFYLQFARSEDGFESLIRDGCSLYVCVCAYIALILNGFSYKRYAHKSSSTQARK